MAEDKSKGAFGNIRFVVYHDKKYHLSWIDRNSSIKIVEYFSSEDRPQKFHILNASQSKKWIEECITSPNPNSCNNRVLVFSQDMIPDKLAKNPSPNSVIRRFLDNGGRVVWLGEVPFWRQGLGNDGTFDKEIKIIADEQRTSEKKGDPKYWRDWNYNGIFSILGLNCEFNNAPAEKVQITKDGTYFGLKSSWYGTRPVPENAWDDILVLGQSTALRFKQPSLLSPEEKTSNLDDKITNISKSLTGVITLLAIVIGLGTTTIIIDWLEIYNLLFLIPIIRFAIIIYTLYYLFKDRFRKWFPRKYTNAWVKVYNKKYPNSGFIRIWDKLVYDLTDSELEELYQVSICNILCE